MCRPSGIIALQRYYGRACFCFTSRHGGVSQGPFATLNLGYHVGDIPTAVAENRRRVLATLKISHFHLVEAQQVHSNGVAVVTRKAWPQQATLRNIISATDALLTRDTDIVLALFYADCVPIFLTDEQGTAIGLVHAGWRGTAATIAIQTVRAWEKAFGLAPSSLRALIGPCVGRCCYDVAEHVAEVVLNTIPHGEDPNACCQVRNGKLYLDLARINALQLLAAGVAGECIEITGHCTCCERERFFSVRSDGQITGRCGALAWINPF
ncbi:MAG: peptidoglycan editing factor PgeF [Candidatus Zipacnadales bacterium]